MEWQPISTAPKDGTPLLLILKEPTDIYDGAPKHWGRTFVARHNGIIVGEDGDTRDYVGWSLAGPFGHGGWTDEYFAGWMPLPDPPNPHTGD